MDTFIKFDPIFIYPTSGLQSYFNTLILWILLLLEAESIELETVLLWSEHDIKYRYKLVVTEGTVSTNVVRGSSRFSSTFLLLVSSFLRQNLEKKFNQQEEPDDPFTTLVDRIEMLC